jgi:Protein of unknown function (DUF3987)
MTNSSQIQRFSHGVACPVCGGSDDDQRGNGTRCYGFRSGEWVHCTREDFGGGCDFHQGSNTFTHRLHGNCRCGVEHGPPRSGTGKNTIGEIDHVYKYRDELGVVLFEVLRYKNPRDFRQRKPGQKPPWSINGVRTVLYNLPAILAGDPDQPVWIVEGEKDADRLGSLGLLATCNPMGAGKWKDDYSQSLKGRHCLIIPDNDKAGRDHAQQVARSLQGKAASVKIVELPGLPQKGDVSDFLDYGFAPEILDQLARDALESRGGCVGFVGEFPEVSPISVSLRPVPKLDERMLPDRFRAWLQDIVERACCPLDLPAIAALVAVSAAAGRRVAIRPKRRDNWTVVPNLWGMGVLPPGWLKTHCLEEPKKPLDLLERQARDKHAVALREHALDEAVAAVQAEAARTELKVKARKKNGQAATVAELRELAAETLAKPTLVPPTLRRYIVNDVTVEKLGELLAENTNGLLLYRDELMGFLMTLEKPGREGDRPLYLEGWNGTGSYTYDRIGRGSLFIPSNTLSMLGGIQPGLLAAYIRSMASGEHDDGLISRFQLAVYPDVDQPFKNVDRWPDAHAQQQAYAVFEKLVELDPSSIGAHVDGDGEIPYLRFADDAQDFFDTWRSELENRVRSSREAANITSHLSKYRSLMPSLALLFHLIEIVTAATPGKVSLMSSRRAAAWCQYLEDHARRIYQAAFDGDPEPAIRLAERIKSGLPSPFKTRDVLIKGWKGLATKDEVARAVSLLEDHGWLARQEIPTTPATGGRPTAVYHINPAVLK